jgi:hypothetical protein
MQQEFNFEDYNFNKQVEEILEAAGADNINPPPDLAAILISFSETVYIEAIKSAPKEIDEKVVLSVASRNSVIYTGLLAIGLALKYPSTADVLQGFMPDRTLHMIDLQVELLQTALKNDGQVAEEEPQRLDPDCDVCSKPVKLHDGAVWVDRKEIFNAELDHRLKPETDEAIDMRQYSAPDRVHIYFGHLDCQDHMIQNSYAAETYLLSPSSLLNLSAHLFTKRWFKHSDYPGFARKWSKRF